MKSFYRVQGSSALYDRWFVIKIEKSVALKAKLERPKKGFDVGSDWGGAK